MFSWRKLFFMMSSRNMRLIAMRELIQLWIWTHPSFHNSLHPSDIYFYCSSFKSMMISALCLGVCCAQCGLQWRKDMILAGRFLPERPEPQHLTSACTHGLLATFIHCKNPPTYGYHKFKQANKFLCHSFEFSGWAVVTPLGLTLILMRSSNRNFF